MLVAIRQLPTTTTLLYPCTDAVRRSGRHSINYQLQLLYIIKIDIEGIPMKMHTLGWTLVASGFGSVTVFTSGLHPLQ